MFSFNYIIKKEIKNIFQIAQKFLIIPTEY